MSDEKRERIRQAKLRQWTRYNVRKPHAPLTRDRIEELAKVDHVRSVVPLVLSEARVRFGTKMEDTFATGASLENKSLSARLVAGEYLPSEEGRSVLVSEFLLYRLGITDDEDVNKVLGQKIQLDVRGYGQSQGNLLMTVLTGGRSKVSAEENLVLQKVIEQLPDAIPKLNLTAEEKAILQKALQKKPDDPEPIKDERITEEFTIVGVFREATKEDSIAGWWMEQIAGDAEVVLPLQTSVDLACRSHYAAEQGVGGVTVTVDSEEHLSEVTRQIDEMGLHEFSLVEVADNVRRNILLLSIFTGFIAFVALLVASLGITNTMLMSILERTHEIGVMKAVGARDRHIQVMFLFEGALIGMLGGFLGLLASWLASFPGDSIARRQIELQTRGTMEGSVFAFPLLLTLGVPLFACLVTTLAAAYPARRASRVDPITALRHE
jgi:putative ABC transport system permease protein